MAFLFLLYHVFVYCMHVHVCVYCVRVCMYVRKWACTSMWRLEVSFGNHSQSVLPLYWLMGSLQQNQSLLKCLAGLLKLEIFGLHLWASFLSFFQFLFFCLFCFWDKISLWSPDWTDTHYEDQASMNSLCRPSWSQTPRNMPLWLLSAELKACTTTCFMF